MRTNSMLARRGIRIGLVMNGGVSLAVWMGGVARELHAAATAAEDEHVETADEPGDADTVARLWEILLARANVMIDLDVIAGTSAGGLNGTILASCLAQGAPFPELREVWAGLGQVSRDKLLRPLDTQADADAPRSSLLDGSFFETRVTEVFAKIEETARTRERREVECLVTSTAISSASLRLLDDYGRAVDYVDSRRVFRFAYDKAFFTFDPVSGQFEASDTGNGFTDSNTTARAARASASYPVAFAPVPESEALKQHRWVATRSPDGVLVAGAKDSASGGGPSVAAPDGDADRRTPSGSTPGDRVLLPRTWLMDGGVLDNAPFEPVLESIQRRAIDGPWRRVLAYVIPSGSVTTVTPPPAHPGGQADSDLPEQPGIPQVLGAVANAWREGDARLDADAIDRHRSSATRADFSAERLIGEAKDLDTVPEWLAAAQPLFDVYRGRRARALERSGFPDAAWLVPETLVVDPHRWNWGEGVALKILRWWGRELNATSGVDPVALRQLGGIQAHTEAVARAMGKIRDAAEMSAGSSTGVGSTALDPRTETCLQELLRQVKEGATIYATALRGAPLVNPTEEDRAAAAADGRKHLRRALAVEVVTFAGSSGIELVDIPPFSYLRMGPDVSSPACPPGARDELGKWGSMKLHGTALNHFAGFVDEDWRRQDWTWGRLDAVAHLVDLVVAESPTFAALAQQERAELVRTWQVLLQEAVLRDEQRQPLAHWVEAAAAFAAQGGSTNRAVMDHLHTSTSGQTMLTHTFDEVLGLLATLATERSQGSRVAARLARHGLFLERPRPRSPLGRVGRASAALPSRALRRRIEEWISTPPQ